MSLPDIAVVNFSSVPDADAQAAIRAVNRQVLEDFQPIWGSAYLSKLHAALPLVNGQPMQDMKVPAEAVIYLVDQPSIPGALGYHDMNNAEVPVGFVFTDLGDWTVTLSHEVLELIVDPTVNILVPGPDPRQPANPNAWLFHTYEVCDAVERTEYHIDGITVSNFLTPSYFKPGNAPGTRNDFLGVGVDSFGVTPGSHLGTIDPTDFSWVEILGSQVHNRSTVLSRLQQFEAIRQRSRASEQEERCLANYHKAPAAKGTGLQNLTALTRSGRKRASIERRRLAIGRMHAGV
jgi:hypothetical protein